MIYHGDLFDVLPTLAAESVDACVCDPPYGLEFMGKAWDKIDDLQAWHGKWSREVLRVLKPGGHLLAFGGTRTFHRLTCGIEDAGFEVRDCLSWLYGSGFPKSLNVGNGQGTALKPGWEPIILARKPIVGTVAANIMRYGTGALNIDLCRLSVGEGRDRDGEPTAKMLYADNGGTNFAMQPGPRGGSSAGRWPANVCLDEAAAAALDEQSGVTTSGAMRREVEAYDGDSVTGLLSGRSGPSNQHGDTGGASRFYYVAKPNREERDFGAVNKHPTVKPIELMRWLVKMVVPVDGICLDPFLGSGTTGIACKYEQRRFIGIERDSNYFQLAERRIKAVCPLFNIAEDEC